MALVITDSIFVMAVSMYHLEKRWEHAFSRHSFIIVINALVFNKLFCCSTVLSNTTQSYLDKPPSSIEFSLSNCERAGKSIVTSSLKGLHWLPVKQQLYFLLAMIFILFSIFVWINYKYINASFAFSHG